MSRRLVIAIDARVFEKDIINGYTMYLVFLISNLRKSNVNIILVSSKPIVFSNSLIKNLPNSIIPGNHMLHWEQLSLPKFLRAHDFDYYLATTNLGLPLLYWGKTKLLLTINDLIPLKYPRYYLIPRPKYMIYYLISVFISVLKAKHIFTISEASKNDLKRLFPWKDIIVTLIDLPKPAKINVKKRNQFIYIGGVDPRKKIENLIKAFAEFAKSHPDYKLVLLGRGYEIFTDLIESLEIKKNIVITGFVSENNKNKYLQQSLALVYPSLYEGYGLAIAEAFLADIPVIAGRAGSQTEIGGKGVLYIDPTSVTSIKKAMQRVINENVRRKLAVARANQVKRLFGDDINKQMQKLIDVLGKGKK